MIRKIVYILALIFFSACSSDKLVNNTDKPEPGLFSKDASKGISITDLLNPRLNPSGINVNGYLWRASLKVLSVAPLISTDALGGTIITDWYVNKNIKDKRIKLTAYISTSELRSDGIEVKVYVQRLIDNVWTDTVTDRSLAIKIEDNILYEARNLRVNSSN